MHRKSLWYKEIGPKVLHPALQEHKDVQVLAAMFCKCSRGLWMQREHGISTKAAMIIHEIAIGNRFTAVILSFVSAAVGTILDLCLEKNYG